MEVTTTARNEGPTLNLKRGEKKGSEQNHVLSEGRSKHKPTRLSDERVENNLLNHSENIYIYIYISIYKTSSQIIMVKQICVCGLIFSLKLMG